MLDVQSEICLEETCCSLANCQNPGGKKDGKRKAVPAQHAVFL